MTTPKAKFAGLVLIAALCAGFTVGLTAPAWGHEDKLAHPNQLGLTAPAWAGLD